MRFGERRRRRASWDPAAARAAVAELATRRSHGHGVPLTSGAVSDDPRDAHTWWRLHPPPGAAEITFYVYDNIDVIEVQAGTAASFLFEDLRDDPSLVATMPRIESLVAAIVQGRLAETIAVDDGEVAEGTARIDGVQPVRHVFKSTSSAAREVIAHAPYPPTT